MVATEALLGICTSNNAVIVSATNKDPIFFLKTKSGFLKTESCFLKTKSAFLKTKSGFLKTKSDFLKTK